MAPCRRARGSPDEQVAEHALAALASKHAIAERLLVHRWLTAAEALATAAPTGSLPADIGAIAGLDVYSTLTDGVTTANDAFATVDVDGSKRLWKVDLLTGNAQDLGELGASVGSLALKLDQ